MLKFKNGETILFTGDSTTDSGRSRPVGEGLWDGVGNGYVRTIDTMLNVFYPELILHVINTGCGGNTSRDLVGRWQKDVLDLNPDYVVCMIGINDLWRQFDSPGCKNQQVGLPEYRENLRKMIKSTLTNVKEMILMTPFFMETNENDPMRKKTDEYIAAMKEIAAEYNVRCIDLQKVFCDYLAYRHPCYISWDRVHPGWIGSMLIAKTFLAEVGFDRPVIE